MVDKMWVTANAMSYDAARYHDRPGAKPGFEKLETSTEYVRLVSGISPKLTLIPALSGATVI